MVKPEAENAMDTEVWGLVMVDRVFETIINLLGDS
jgi:hypothetical protein